jgi:hypothetical protein
MRPFTRQTQLIAAIIVAFRGPTVITDDGDEINVGDGWLGQKMPAVGDTIYADNGGYGLIRAATFAEQFVDPDAPDAPDAFPRWALFNQADLEYAAISEEGALSGVDSVVDAAHFASEENAIAAIASLGTSGENFAPLQVDDFTPE